MVEGNPQNQVPSVKVIAEPEGLTKKGPKDDDKSKVSVEDLDRSKIGAQDGADNLNSPKVDDDKVVDVDHFRCILVSETSKLQELCSRWQNVDDIPQHWKGEVRSTVGKAKLLMAERFDQFSGLVDDCEFCRGEKKTTCQDLAGFWDMVFLQVEEILESFERLEGAKEKGWPELVEENCKALEDKVAKVKVVVPRRKAPSGKSNIKAMIAARRAELAGKSPPAGGALLQPHQEVKTFEGGFFNIKSPMGKPKVSPRCSNKAALLGRKLINLPDLSPLTKVSAQAKHCLEKTTRTRLFLETDDIEATNKQIAD